jgi:hypothetical protein
VKGFIVALCILVAMVTSLFFYQNALFKISGEMLERIDKIKHYARDDKWEKVDREMKHLTAMWEDVSYKLSLVIDHEEIDLIMISLFKANEYKEYEEVPEFMAEITNLEKLIDHIPNKEKLSIENIL